MTTEEVREQKPDTTEMAKEDKTKSEVRTEASDDRNNSDLDESDAPVRKRRRPTLGDAIVCRPVEVQVRDDRVEQAIRQLKNRMALFQAQRAQAHQES